ncbi:hypothetical protein, partial [Pseudoxanthomonas beigongshangi]|uniref:hypothetical protein n=1 Tax=Pseudoxanthomonas beigongshangi TaxID=2782537 RepID=UPI001F38B7EC
VYRTLAGPTMTACRAILAVLFHIPMTVLLANETASQATVLGDLLIACSLVACQWNGNNLGKLPWLARTANSKPVLAVYPSYIRSNFEVAAGKG